MSTKSITIDPEAYRRLENARRDGESFSETIKRLTPKEFDYEKWLKSLGKNPFSGEFIEAVEEKINQRRSPGNVAHAERRPRRKHRKAR